MVTWSSMVWGDHHQNSMIKFQTNQDCCHHLLGQIRWEGTTGYLAQCPGEDLHSNFSQSGHCIVYTDRVPTVYCVHQSCAPIIEQANHDLRRKIRKLYLKGGLPVPWNRSAIVTTGVVATPQTDRLADEARLLLPDILEKFSWHPDDAYSESKSCLNPARQWQQHLSLFNPFDLVWIGHPWETGAKYASHFRLAREWMEFKRQPYGQLICPSTFKRTLSAGTVADKTVERKNRHVDRRALLVLESDTMNQKDSCSVYKWCRQFMRLRALIHSGNKSIHGWFDFPDAVAFDQLKIMLPALGMDASLIRTPSQAARFAGARRENGKYQFQQMIWFDQPNPTWQECAPFLFSNDPA
jgi:hypothetical protein